MEKLEKLTAESTDEEILSLLDSDTHIDKITPEDYFHVYCLFVENARKPCRYYDESLWTAVQGSLFLTELRQERELPVQIIDAFKDILTEDYWRYRCTWLWPKFTDEERGDSERKSYLQNKKEQSHQLFIPAKKLVGSFGRENPDVRKQIVETRDFVLGKIGSLNKIVRKMLVADEFHLPNGTTIQTYDHFTYHGESLFYYLQDLV
jgi:hypothetical protein